MKTLTKHEVAILSAFLGQVDVWKSQNDNNADKVKIEYDAETDDFEIVTNEPGTSRRRRFSKLFADIVYWANGQLNYLEYAASAPVKKLLCKYEHDEYSIELVFQEQEEEPQASLEQDNESV